ncbi:MAG: hypothetical protein NDI63_15045 [Pseudobdellovibrio sp.]|nr:hypothetical protein [Pseudobdellovibrio sp.]
MAPKLTTVNNNKGQALIETTGLLIMAGAFLYVLLRCLLSVIVRVSLDAAAEDYFFCELANKANCAQRLERRLVNNQMREVSYKVQKSTNKIVLTVSASRLSPITISREFDYEKFRQKF